MKITPKQESEVSGDGEWPLLPDGTYPFTVLGSDEVPSKSEKNKGRMMYALKLNVHGPKSDVHVYTHFADWFSEWLLRHFAATTGQIKAYESGDFDGSMNKFAGKVGYVKIKTEPAKGNYPARNAVADFIVREAAPAKDAPAPPGPDDDSVPF